MGYGYQKSITQKRQSGLGIYNNNDSQFFLYLQYAKHQSKTYHSWITHTSYMGNQIALSFLFDVFPHE